jgi:hypothetical protein
VEQKLDFNLKGWKKEFMGLLQRERLALQSWNRLRDGGADIGSLTLLLYLCCDFKGSPGRKALAIFIGECRETARIAPQLAKRFESDKKAATEFYDETFFDEGSKASREALSKLDLVISDLRNCAVEARPFCSKRSWNPSFFLAWAITEINETLGRPCYREVANLLDVAYMAHGREARATGEDAVRKLYRRFLRMHPDAFFLDPEKRETYVFGFGITVLISHLMEQIKSAPTTGRIPASQ